MTYLQKLEMNFGYIKHRCDNETGLSKHYLERVPGADSQYSLGLHHAAQPDSEMWGRHASCIDPSVNTKCCGKTSDDCQQLCCTKHRYSSLSERERTNKNYIRNVHSWHKCWEGEKYVKTRQLHQIVTVYQNHLFCYKLSIFGHVSNLAVTSLIKTGIKDTDNWLKA